MRRISIAIFFLLLFVPSVFAAQFRASRNSNKYHYTSCRWAKKIKPYNLIIFESPEDAIKAGYIPCKVCRPPLPEKVDSKTSNEP
ncbi:hypothetical protein BMS3Abin07_02399 [bacterium BMS3Abin07]|nr:hypothetical protein BMS3Abin07_02399 [bacterium BMS3Abin07]GBE31424.1 hypothetical protein BMS3Bbin05_00324 [bacterium BMS3Bbin05]HDL21253.1 hypothetical protein [Nitrospirota bacterium]HDO22183.1 hypothetical protein [Nitrospirota bacterium]HDZ87347.1 hypothetical protein [Nitrospirota bacterium]